MGRVKKQYLELNNFFKKIASLKFFNEIYVALLSIVAIIGWKYDLEFGMSVLIISAVVILFLANDLKFVIPNLIFFLFSINIGFSSFEMPIWMFTFGGIFAVLVLLFSFKGGIHLGKMRSVVGLLGLAITNVIPIIWGRNIPEGNEIFYFFFFVNFGFLLMYIIMVNGIKDNAIELLSVTMSYLIIIISFQCAVMVYEQKDKVTSIFQLWYYVGWGLCNEAGIMLSVAIPFTFYLLSKQETLGGMIFQNFKIIIGVIGMLLTTSRGTYVFGLAEVVVLYIVLMFTSKNARKYQNAFIVYFFMIIGVLLYFKKEIIDFITEVLEYVFYNDLDDNGRVVLWKEAFALWNKEPYVKFFGPGYLAAVRDLQTPGGYQMAPVVFHSTYFQTMAVGGALGLLFLGIHFYEKYNNLNHTNKYFISTVGLGYFFVDLYGMIDNTYHMFYYMLPLTIIMAVVDTSKKEEKYVLNLKLQV